jgi:DNA-binding NarL/FixJ family response regulator
MDTKICAGPCGQEKPMDQFWPGDRKCKRCRNDAIRLRYQTDEEFRNRMARYQREHYRRTVRRNAEEKRKAQMGANESDSSAMARLTPMELAVTKALLSGHTTREAVAAYLVLSPKTVQTHLTNIFQKLHIASAIELVLVAISEGMEINTSWQQLTDKRNNQSISTKEPQT